MQCSTYRFYAYIATLRGSEYLPAASTSGFDPAHLRRRVAGVVDGQSSACRFRRDRGPANGERRTVNGSRRTTVAWACDSQRERSGLTCSLTRHHRFGEADRPSLRGLDLTSSAPRSSLTHTYHHAVLVSPDPPPSYLYAFLVHRRVNPHAETNLGQSYPKVIIASLTLIVSLSLARNPCLRSLSSHSLFYNFYSISSVFSLASHSSYGSTAVDSSGNSCLM